MFGNLDSYGILPSSRDVFEKLPDKEKVEWTTKQKRTFRHLLSGVKVTKLLGCELKFLTLTTSDLCYNQESYDDYSLSRDWIRLKQRIERVTPYKLYKWGYLTKRQIGRYYGRENYNKPIVEKIQYCKVVTNEGNGVIHLLMRCGYLPYNYLASEWMDVHLSWDVNITNINLSSNGSMDVASYIVSQYVANQQNNTSYVRGSQSKSWVFPGSMKAWRQCLKDSGFCKNYKKGYKTPYGSWYFPPDLPYAIQLFENEIKEYYGLLEKKPLYIETLIDEYLT